ncbi:MAG: TaqI-like C-terminal specificity domain-containing protein [Bacteroidota bacterium]|nr:TaqI-like C-terminal specificity domain-containing protein [Bacteroidota bacterium]
MNEAETRLRFIDPFFEALGWDIRNPKEVRIESVLARTDSTRPDYRFLIDGKTKFFVEAKKPSVKLTDPAPIFQAKSYGFSSKVSVVILTDFEEFRPFRTLARPKFDRPLDGLIKEFDFTYDRYVDEFDTLYDIFSREAVGSGALEKHIPIDKKEASKTVDKEFLADLSTWQEELAKNIALRNSKLSVGEINEAVQRILDRMIFLRICEDRQIEESEILLSYKDKEEIYKKLLKEFARLRLKFNGLIFNEHELTENLAIDDKLLKDIIKNLYLPYSPYRFNEIPIEILGTIYEQFLGRVITLTPTHRAKVDIKPEVRKAGGVFYTPQFITSYIVKNTIGTLIEGKTPEQISKLKFADIACGSGSFLLEMFDYLIRYHIDYYGSNPGTIKTTDGIPDAYKDAQELWHLSSRKKKEILLNNIYGIDIDPQAVEVTQMSLYLKFLEGENAESFDKQLTLELKETILPTLSNNIKCGNSLVGMDIKGLGNNLSLEDELRIRPFDWETAFPEIMRPSTSSGQGFDAIIGNPPYVRQETLGGFKSYFEEHYNVYHGIADLYTYFIEKGFSLLKNGGLFSYIVANKWMRANYGDPLRKWMKEKSIEEIIDFGDLPVFQSATTYPCIIRLKKSIPQKSLTVVQVKSLDSLNLEKYVSENGYRVTQENLQDSGWSLSDESTLLFLDKLKDNCKLLGDYVEGKIYRGVLTGLNEAFVIDKETRDEIIREDSKSKELIKPFLAGRDIKRYAMPEITKYLILIPSGWTNENSKGIRDKWSWFENTYPAIAKHLKVSEADAKARYDQGEYWWELRSCDYYTEFEKPKIMLPDISTRGNFILDDQDTYCVNTCYIISSSDKYLLGILNSKLMTFFYSKISSVYRGGYLRFIYQYLVELPIRTIDFNNPEEKAMHDKMVQLVERMLDLHKKKQQSKAESEKELFEHQVKATDREIDQLVYKLYNITEEARNIIDVNTLK